MIRLLFVGDGERDAATNPHLVSTIIGAPVAPATTGWPRLSRAGSGYDRKLLFAIRTARHTGLDGVVATVDRDKSRRWDRLRDCQHADQTGFARFADDVRREIGPLAARS
jgi:hypothetical protein